LFGLSPNALCRINLRLISYAQYYWANDFFRNWKLFDAIKKFVINTI